MDFNSQPHGVIFVNENNSVDDSTMDDSFTMNNIESFGMEYGSNHTSNFEMNRSSKKVRFDVSGGNEKKTIRRGRTHSKDDLPKQPELPIKYVGIRNPYNMDWNKVKVAHFKSARHNDPEEEKGFVYQKSQARRYYRRWLKTVRQQEGWADFRREENTPSYNPLANSTIIPGRYVKNPETGEWVLRTELNQIMTKLHDQKRNQYNQNRKMNRSSNSNAKFLPQSTVKGVSIDDDEFRPKLFTHRMGQQISQIRHSLKMTQSELAKKINVEANVIRNIELGGLITFNSEDSMVINLAKALELPSIRYEE
jgi:DNA-binding XRE family transcriptional regulator